MWTETLWNTEFQPLQWGVVTGASLTAAILDLFSGRIPNWLTIPVFLCGLAWAWSFAGLAGLADALCGGLLAAMPFLVLFVSAGGGAGDVKMMAAVGVWLGVLNALAALAAVCAAGIVLAVIVSLGRRRLSSLARAVGLLACGVWAMPGAQGNRRPLRHDTMPYGPAIFAGVLAAAIGVHVWRIS